MDAKGARALVERLALRAALEEAPGRWVEEVVDSAVLAADGESPVDADCRPRRARRLARQPADRTGRVRYRRLGSSDLTVSEIGLGSWLTYSGGVSREQAVACVDAAFEAGITFIDTANVYGRGAAEELLGDVLSSRPRDSYVLATKVYGAMSSSDRGLSPSRSTSRSTRRSRAFAPTSSTSTSATATTGHAARGDDGGADRGRPRRQGPLPRLQRMDAGPDPRRACAADVERFVSSQPEYSLLQRRIEAEVIPLCETEGISQVVWSPLGAGRAHGQVPARRGAAGGTRATSSSMGQFVGRFLRDDVLEAVQRLGAIADRLGLTTAQLALAWMLRQPNVAAAIVGASRPEQVVENAAASGVELDAETLAEIELAFSGVASRAG